MTILWIVIMKGIFKMNSKEINQRINRHYLSDGLLEVVVGGWLLLFIFAKQMELAEFSSTLYWLLMLGLPLSLGPGLRLIKKYTSDPRIGYIQFTQTPENLRVAGIVGAGVVLFMLLNTIYVLLWSEGFLFNLDIVFMPMLLAAFYLFLGVYYKIGRMVITSMFLMMMGLLIAQLPLDEWIAIWASAFISVMTVLLSGCVMFAKFLHDNPVADEDDF